MTDVEPAAAMAVDGGEASAASGKKRFEVRLDASVPSCAHTHLRR